MFAFFFLQSSMVHIELWFAVLIFGLLMFLGILSMVLTFKLSTKEQRLDVMVDRVITLGSRYSDLSSLMRKLVRADATEIHLFMRAGEVGVASAKAIAIQQRIPRTEDEDQRAELEADLEQKNLEFRQAYGRFYEDRDVILRAGLPAGPLAWKSHLHKKYPDLVLPEVDGVSISLKLNPRERQMETQHDVEQAFELPIIVEHALAA